MLNTDDAAIDAGLPSRRRDAAKAPRIMPLRALETSASPSPARTAHPEALCRLSSRNWKPEWRVMSA